jgi:hypothetical protein
MILTKPTRHTFDVANKEHRKIAAEALKRNSWSRAPYLFELESDYSDIMTMVRNKMFSYYVATDVGVL